MTPVDGKQMDMHKFAELGRRGVLLLMSDSTNAERPGYTESETTVGHAFRKAFRAAKGRIILATFARIFPVSNRLSIRPSNSSVR